MSSPESVLSEEITQFVRDPLNCAIYSFPWGEQGELVRYDGPREWQADILRAIGDHLESPEWHQPLKIAVSSGHGIGKSALIAMVLHWAMSTCVDTRCLLTAGKESQLVTKTWPELRKWFRLCINAHWFTPTATRISYHDPDRQDSWRIDRETWSENNTEAFAGLHNQGKRLVVVYDEASAIADRVWEVTEGAMTDEDTEIIWLAFGNPTQNTGRFRECFGRFKHRWIGRQIDSRTVPGTNKALLEGWINDYGKDSDFCRVRVRGEFPRAGSSQFIASDIVAEARKRSLEPREYERHWKILICDVARFGDDQTVIGLRQGRKLTILEKLRGQDTTQVAMRLMRHMDVHEPRMTVVDGDGIGAGVVDYVRLHKSKWLREHAPCRLEEFHGGRTPDDPEMYFNHRAECWGRARAWLKDADIPDDAELEADLTGPEYFFSNKNQIQLEKKEDMKGRGLASPDTGDMLAMSFTDEPTAKTAKEKFVDASAEVAERYDDPTTRAIRLRELALKHKNAGKTKHRWRGH